MPARNSQSTNKSKLLLLRSRGVGARPSWDYFELRKALDPELRYYFDDDGWVHHPLIIQPDVNAARIPDINALYRKKKAAAQQAEREGDWERLISICERPYRIKALRKALRRIADPKEAACLVGDVWTDSENIRQHRPVWLSIWTKLTNPWAAMDEKDQAEFAKFSKRVTIFRGHCGRCGLTNGLAWTMDQSKAEWFAHRYPEDGPPLVASGWVFKKDVFAYFTCRNEFEIVVNPAKVTVTKVLPL